MSEDGGIGQGVSRNIGKEFFSYIRLLEICPCRLKTSAIMSQGTRLEIPGGVVGKPIAEFGLISPELVEEFASGDLVNAVVGIGVDEEGALIVDSIVSSSLGGGSDRHNVHIESGLVDIDFTAAIFSLNYHAFL